jgi:signal transduction histidine kinase
LKPTILTGILILVIQLLSSCLKQENKSKKNVKNPKTRSLFTDKAYAFQDSGKSDSAFAAFAQAKELYLKNKDSVMLASTLTNMAIIATEAGDNFNGQEYSMEALKYLDAANEEHHRYILSNLNNLGISSYDLKKYDQSIEFYRQSLPLITDSSSLHITKNNIANAYRESGKYQPAIRLYEEVLAKAPADGTRARTITNLAEARWRYLPKYDPVPSYLTALEIRKKIGDLWGQNSSYAHLANYYWTVKPNLALYYSRLMYDLALKLKNPDNELEALSKLADLDGQHSLAYFRRYRRLEDSIAKVRNAAKNQFALIRYETEKHKSERFRLEKESAEKEIQISRRTYALGMAAIIVLATIIISIMTYRKRKRRLAEEAEKAVRESKLRTSKEIHDVVANGLYRMMSEVEYGTNINKDRLLNQIEGLYYKSREISHAVVAQPADFLERFNELISSFSTAEVKIVTAGLNDELDAILNESLKDEIILILQELLVNMHKHSQASLVVLRFETNNKSLKIQYRDNGVGMAADASEGLGLRNTENRIAALKGVITFENHADGGLKIIVRVPLKLI